MTNLIDKLDALYERYDSYSAGTRQIADEFIGHWPAIAKALRAADVLEGALDPRCWCEGISGEEVCPACKYREALDALKEEK